MWHGRCSLPAEIGGTREKEARLISFCDFGHKIGRAYIKTDPDKADHETILKLLMRGQYTGPLQLLEVGLGAGNARDVSAKFDEEIMERSRLDDLPFDVATFISSRPLARKNTRSRRGH